MSSMNSVRVHLKFSGQQLEVLQSFCKQLGMSYEVLCKQAILYAMQDWAIKSEQEEGRKLQELRRSISSSTLGENSGLNDAVSTDAPGNPEGTLPVPGVSTAALPFTPDPPATPIKG